MVAKTLIVLSLLSYASALNLRQTPSCTDPGYPYQSQISYHWPQTQTGPKICYSEERYATGAASVSCNGWCCMDQSCTASSCTVQYCQTPSTTTLAPTTTAALPEATVANCGKAPFYPNSKPLSYGDARDTRYSNGAFQDNTFVAGQSITYKCDNGFTVDASAAGNTTYEVTCADQGYFMPSGACLKASKCGALPEIPFASPTGKEGVAPGSVEFACQVGYSLDGEKVVAGGFGKNRFFPMRCQEFGGWEQFNGECKPYAFMPSSKAAAMYTKVFDTLFEVTCKSSMHKRFEEGRGLPETSTICAGFDAAQGDCESLVGQLKSDFESEKAARESWEATHGDNWATNASAAGGRPDIDDEADAFCAQIWRLMGH